MSDQNCTKVLQALLQCKDKLREISKDAQMPAVLGGKRATSIENVVREVRAVMNETGLLLIPEKSEILGEGARIPDKEGKASSQCNVRVRISYSLWHVSGEKYPTPITIEADGADNSDKGCAKAYAFCRKLILFDLLQLPRGDDPEVDRKATAQANKLPTARPNLPETPPTTPITYGFGVKP